ncbi:hypothetical protein K239x_39440 [Planctomycetes bacterium K23_9]|uniref:Uncharacterized protein n=1 Tax=Stieleria marina TaxID=1930275 RepID=A0A517NXU2_9BACT|nr:hypothetical protein K239x_39440 [Planctomycetes bacterium K23_9]
MPITNEDAEKERCPLLLIVVGALAGGLKEIDLLGEQLPA